MKNELNTKETRWNVAVEEANEILKKNPTLIADYGEALRTLDEDKLVDVMVTIARGFSAEGLAYACFYVEKVTDKFKEACIEDDELYEKMIKVSNLYDDLEDEEDEGD